MTATGSSVLVGQALEDVLEGVLEDVLENVDRREALGEAQVAVLEAAVQLMRAAQPECETLPQDRTELVREALGAMRAATAATGHALMSSRRVLAAAR